MAQNKNRSSTTRLASLKLWRSGQAMLLAILALNGALIGATIIAGFLMVYQIRQATDGANSAQAIFAADAGVECGLYNYFKQGSPPNPPSCPLSAQLSNGARYNEVTTIDLTNPAVSKILSKGFYRTATRSLLLHN